MTSRKILPLSLLLIFFFTLTSNIFAQAQTYTVSGKVIDDDMGVPLEYANISITKPNDPDFIDGGVTDVDGNFSLEIPQGTYNISVEFISFGTKTFANQEVNDDLDLGTIELGISSDSHDEVVVTSETTQTSLFSQEEEPVNNEQDDTENVEQREDFISVFLDCPCDTSFVQQELDFVNFARDQELAQVHIFATRQRTSNGTIFSLSFIGKKEFDGINNSLSYTSVQNNTEDEEREGLTEMIKLGLVPYIAQTLADNITLDISGMSETREPEGDAWNNWLFEIYGGLNFEEETSQSSLRVRYGLEADYVTETWRIRLTPYFNYNQRDYVRNGENVRSVLHRNGFDGRVIRSISDHWSIGIFSEITENTFQNIKFGYRVAPAIEYSLLPYSRALRTEYTIGYSIGYMERNYLEETIYDKISETLYDQELELGVRVLEPWGTVRAGIEVSHFLHDMSKNRLSVDGRLSIRLFEGLSVNFSSRYEYVRDQLSLPKGDASLEDVLLQQRQLATTYGISASVGISYSFGSIYNNVVNTRL